MKQATAICDVDKILVNYASLIKTVIAVHSDVTS